jgi:hypothetical protein
MHQGRAALDPSAARLLVPREEKNRRPQGYAVDTISATGLHGAILHYRGIERADRASQALSDRFAANMPTAPT